MVEEQFKLGLTVELEQQGLPELRKLIEKEVQQAISVSGDKIRRGVAAGPATRAAPGESLRALLKSASDAVNVSTKDLGKKVVQLSGAINKLESSSDSNAKTIQAAADKIDNAIRKLVAALDRGGRAAGGAGGGPGGGGGAAGGGGAPPDDRRLKEARRNAVKELERSASMEKALNSTLAEFEVNLDEGSKDLDALSSELERARKTVKSFQSSVKAQEQEIKKRQGEGRGTKTKEKELSRDKKRLAAAQEEVKALEKSRRSLQKQVKSLENLVSAADSHAQALNAAQEAASAVTTSSKATADQLEATRSRLKGVTDNLSGVSNAADKLAGTLDLDSAEATKLAQKVRATAGKLDARQKVISDEITASQKARQAKAEQAKAAQQDAKASQESAKLTKQEVEQKKKTIKGDKKGEQLQKQEEKADKELIGATKELAEARREAAKREKAIAEGKVGTGVTPGGAQGADKRAADRAKAREKTRRDTELAAAGTSRNIARVKEVAANEARQPSDITVSKTPAGKSVSGDPKMDKGDSAASKYMKSAEAHAARLNSTLDTFENAVKRIFPNRPDIMKQLGLDFRAQVGEGGAVQVKDRSGQLRVMMGTVDVFEGQVQRVGDVLGDLLTELTASKGGKFTDPRMKQVINTAKWREEAAVDMLRGKVQAPLGKMEVFRKGTVGGAFQQQGRVYGRIKLTKEEQERINKLDSEREALIEANKILGQVTGGLEKLAEAGYDVLSSIGLSEGAAPNIEMVQKRGKIQELIVPLQARPLADIGIGGAATMKEQRSFAQYPTGRMKGGHRPTITSAIEKDLYDAKILMEESGRDLVTAVVSLPEAMEDQIPILRSVAEKLMTTTFETATVGELGPGIKEGLKVTKDTLLGTLGKEDIKFELGPAFEGEVDKIEEVMIDGVKKYRLYLQKTTVEGMGGKGQLLGGLKGKLVPHEDLGTTATGQKIEMIIAPESLAGRGDIRDTIYALSHALSDFTKGKFSPQQVADALIEEMKIVGDQAGDTLGEALKTVTEKWGVKGFTGTQRISGGLIGRGAGPEGVEAVTGKMHLRIAQGQLMSETSRKKRFWSATDLYAMEMAGLGDEAAHFRKALADQQHVNYDLVQSMRVLTASYEDQAAMLEKEGLQAVMPTSFRGLPLGAKQSAEEFEGTLIDPESILKEATAMLLPRFGGQHGLIRMGPVTGPGAAKGLGGRGFFETPEGERGADKLSRLLDRIREVSTAVMTRRGEVDIATSPETIREAAQMGDEAVNAFAASIEERLAADPKDVGALREFDEFMSKFAPYVRSIANAGKYIKFWKEGKAVPRMGPGGTALTGEQYVQQAGVGESVAVQRRNMILAVRDLLFRRTTGGAGDKSVPGLGKLFEPENVEDLRDALALLDVQFDETGKRVNELYEQLYGKKVWDEEQGKMVQTSQGLVGDYQAQLAGMVMGRNKPPDVLGRSLMQQVSGGMSYGAIGRAFAIPGEVGPQLDAAKAALKELGQTGVDVSKSLAAVTEMKGLQGDDVLPQDAILVNRQDFDAWVEELARFEGMDPDIVRRRILERGVITHRDPTTGGGSMQRRRIMIDEGDRVERGAVAVAGTFREAEGQLKTVLAPIVKRVGELRKILHARGGEAGPEIEGVREEFTRLQSILRDLQNTYGHLIQNLDFDGDKISYHADVVSDSAEGMSKSSSKAWQIFNRIIGAQAGTVKGSTLESLEETFRTKTKGIPEEYRRLGMVPQTEEQRLSNVSSLVSGKLTVGMATEVHHRFLMALMAGLEDQDWGGAFKAVLGRLMLNINESLKLKHTGAAGFEKFEPGALIDFIRKGDIKGLTKEMGGGGKFEKLGQFNKEFLASMKDELLALSPDELTKRLAEEGLSDIVPEGGITAGNYKKVIDTALKKMDMRNVFKDMHEILVQGYSKSLEESGMSSAEIKAKIKEKLKGKGKRGPAGIPLDEVIALSFKPWLATRTKFTDKMAKRGGFAQLKEMMAFLPKEILDVVANVMDIEDIDIDREAILESTGVREWASNLRESLLAVRQRLGEQMEVAKLPRGVGARYLEGEGVEAGKGKIQMTSKVMDQLTSGLATLAQIEAGEFEGTAEEATQALHGIVKFLGFLAHERVHQLGQDVGKVPVREIAQNLASVSPRATLGKHREDIVSALSERLPGVRRLAKRAAEWQSKAAEDPTRQVRTKVAGEQFRGTAQELAQRLNDQLMTLIAEELLAYMAQGRLQEILGDVDLGEKALGFLARRLQKLGERDKEVLGAAIDAGERLTSATLEGLMSGVEGGGPISTGGIQGRVGARGVGIGALGEDPISEAQNMLGMLERVLLDAVQEQMFQLSRLDVGALAGGEFALEKRELKGTTAIPTERVERMNEIVNRMKEGIIDPNEEKELLSIASQIRRDKKDPDSYKRYQMVIREYQAAKTAFYINEARKLEKQMQDLLAAGDEGGARAIAPQFQKAVANLWEFLAGTVQQNIQKAPNLVYRGRGKGVTPAAMEAGLVPMAAAFDIPMQAARGMEGEAKRFEKTEQVLWGMKDAIEQNRDVSKQLAIVWEHIKEDPKLATERLMKMADVTKVWAQTFRQANMPAAADNMATLSKHIRQMANDMAKMPEPTLEGMYARLPKGLQQRVFGGGAGEGGLILPLAEQFEALEARAKAHQKRLQSLVESPQFKKMGLKTDFEPIKAQMIDPETNQAVQNLEVRFKRVGKTIEYSMEQGGVATQRFGRRIKDAFRRVVQWGFATGIVYGTMRAFRSLSQVITDVQDRIFSLKKVMDTTTTDFVAMQDAAVGMAKEYGIAINDVLDGMVVYGQQGLKMNEILDRTRATLLAVNVTTLDSTAATEALTAAHKVFGDEITNSTGFVDAWAKVAARHAITAKDLADAVKRAGAAAGTAGMNFEDFMGITTAIGVVTRQTGKEIGTSLKFMMRGMRRPVAQKEFGALGVRSLTETGDLRPAMDLLKDLAGRWTELSKAQQLAVAQAAAGIRHYNSFIILMENFDEALEASADAATSQGFAFRKNQLAMQTLSKQMQVLRETVKSLGIEVGKAILPTVTAATKALSVMINVAAKIPGPMLQIGTLGAAGMLAFHRAADMVVDSLDAMLGYGAEGPRLKNFFGKEGYISGIGKGIAKAGKGVFGGLGGYIDAMAAGTVGTMFDPKQQGLIVRGLERMRMGVVNMAKSFMLLNATMKVASGIMGVALIAAGYGLYKVWSEASKSGQDVADAMYDQIGKSQDLADSYRSQSKQLDRISLAYKKLAQAQKLSQDVPETQKAIAAGEFKGAALAAKAYQDIISEVGKAIATIDPTSITDITDSGELVYEVSEGFAALTDNAVDAQNAITAAMQTKVLKAFAEDITEAKGFVNRLDEALEHLFGFDTDRSLAGQLEESKKRIQELAQYRRELTDAGWDTVAVEEMHVMYLAQHLDLQDKIGESAAKLRQTLEQMPTFENLETLRRTMGPDFMEALRTGAASGEFGRGATAGSIAFQRMAASAGMGGLIDYTTAANPARLIETMIEKGIKPQATLGAPGRTAFPLEKGEIMAVSRTVAEGLLKSITPGFEKFTEEQRSEAIQAAQSLIGDVNSATGDMVWMFTNTLTGELEKASAFSVSEVINTVDQAEAQILIFRKKAIEDSMRQTERLLTLAFTGAMAGIRDPGQFQIGPGSRRELTSEQRVMESLPNSLQRMVDVQKEMQEIQRQYNELIGEGHVEEAAAQMAKSSGQIKVLDQRMQELAMTLQSEGFELSRVLHFNKAIQDLNKTLEEAKLAAEDAAEAEKIRSKYVIETSGALAGLPTLPNITFGKGAKELTGLERLVKRMPDMAKMVKGLDAVMKSRERQVTAREDVGKQFRNFQRGIQDLIDSQEKLTAEQVKLRARQLAKGMAPGEIAIMNAIRDAATEQTSYLSTQTDIQSAILDILSVQADPELSDDERNRQLKKAIGDANMTTLDRLLKEMPGGVRRRAEEAATGVRYVPPDRREGWAQRAYEVDKGAGKRLGLEGETLEQFEELQGRLSYVKQELARATQALPQFGGGGLASTVERFRKQERMLTEKLLEIGKVRDEYRREAESQLQAYMMGSRKDAEMAEIEQARTRQREAQIEGAKQLLLASASYRSAISGMEEELNKTNDTLLKAMEHGRMSEMAENFAKTLEDLIDDFKKAEALELDPDRIKTDLTGPFARVGKPGFKTDFELRREEAEKKLHSRDKTERKAAQEELIKIEFDEKEARIKQQQDIEVKELKKQQDQAEKFRSAIYDALATGEYPSGLEGQMKKVFDTLTSELETAEEAYMTGGDLKFRGVPSLQNVRGLIQQLKEFSAKQAKKAQFELMKKAFEEGGGKQTTAELAYLNSMAKDQHSEEQKQSDLLARILKALENQPWGQHEQAAAQTVAEGIEEAKKEEARAAAARAPASARAAAGPTQYEQARANVQGMLNRGEITREEAARRGAAIKGAEARDAELLAPAAAGAPFLALMRSADEATTSIYKFSDELYAVVTEAGGPGGKVVGSQTFEIRNGIIEMGDNAIVNEGMRGRGIGQAQLEEVARFAKQQGIGRIEASQISLDTRQAAAYERAARATGGRARLIDPGSLEMTETIGGGMSYARKEGSSGAILEFLTEGVEDGARAGVLEGSRELLAEVESRFATQQGFADMPGLANTIDELAAEVEAARMEAVGGGRPDILTGDLTPQAREALAGLGPEEQALFAQAQAAHAEDMARAGQDSADALRRVADNLEMGADDIDRVLRDAAFQRGVAEPGIVGGGVPARTAMEEAADRIAQVDDEGAAQRTEDLIEVVGGRGPRGAKAGTMEDILGTILEEPFDVRGTSEAELMERFEGILAEPAGPRIADELTDFVAEEDRAIQKAIERRARRTGGRAPAGGPEILQGERGAYFEDPELQAFIDEQGLGEVPEAPRGGGRPGEPAYEPRYLEWEGEQIELPPRRKDFRTQADYENYRQQQRLKPIKDARARKAARAKAIEEAGGYGKYLAEKYPRAAKNLGRAGKGLAGVGAALQGAQVGGIMHRAAMGEQVGGDIGMEAGLWALVSGGVMAGGAAGTALGPIGTAGGAILGGLGGLGAGLLGEDYLRYAGEYWDKQTGGALSKGAGAAGEFISQPGAMLGEKYGQTGWAQWLADINVPTWLGGPGAPAAAEPGAVPAAIAKPAAGPAAPAAGGPRTVEDWMRRIQEIQTVAPAAGLPDFTMMGGTRAAADAAGQKFLPSAFTPGAPLPGPKVPKVQVGTAREDYTGADAYFPQAQFFKAPGQGATAAGPYQPFERTRSTIDEAGAYKGIIQALAKEGTRVFRPTEMGEAVRAGAPGSAQRYIEMLQYQRGGDPYEKMRQVAAHTAGPSNREQISDVLDTHISGGPATGSAPLRIDPTTGQQRTGAGSVAERVNQDAEARRDQAAGGTEEGSQAILQALETLNQSLASLSQTGLRLPDNFTQTIEASSAAVVEKLDAVGVTSLPTPIEVSLDGGTITSLSSNIGTALGGAAGGAQQIAESINELKSELLGQDGLVDERVALSTADFDTRISQVENETGDLDDRVTANTDSIVTINDVSLPGIDQSILLLTTETGDLRVDVDANTLSIQGLETEFDNLMGVAGNTAETVEGFQTAIDEVVTTSEQVVTRIGQFEEEFITIQQDVATANTNADSAVSQVNDLRDSLNGLRAELEGKDNTIEESVRTTTEFAQKVRDDLDVVTDRTVPDINKRIENIRGIAESARNASLAAKKV